MVANGINLITYASSLLNETFFLFYFAFLITDIFFDLLTILLFILLNHKNPFLKDFYNFFLSIPIKNRILLGMFTLTYAIPTKVWVNHNLNKFFVSFNTFLLIFISRIDPIFLFFSLFIFVTTLQNYAIIYLYEKEDSFFRKKFDSFLFSDDKFSKEYISFFFGNTKEISEKMIYPSIKGTVAIVILLIFRNREREKLKNTTRQEFNIYIENTDTKPETLMEVFEIKKKIEKIVEERDGVIIPIENKIEKFINWLFGWF